MLNPSRRRAVNPVLTPLDSELVEINEGCLSVPNIRGNVMEEYVDHPMVVPYLRGAP